MKRQIDFSKHLFRASSSGKLMTGVKPNLTANQAKLLGDLKDKQVDGKITDKQLITLGNLLDKQLAKPTLSTTTKTYLEQLHKEVIFDKAAPLTSKYLDKGIQVEEASISLYSDVTDTLFIKNKERKNNDFLTGEADNVQGKIRDIKSSWDLSTFPMFEDEIPNKDYYWQLQCYMELWNIDEAELIYCLVDTPLTLIEDEKRRMSWKMGFIDLPDDMALEIEKNMMFNDVPAEFRCKVYHVKRDKAAMKQLQDQIERCRAYLNGLSEALADKLAINANA